MAASLTIKRLGLTNADFEYLSGHRMRVEIETAVEITDKLFLWHRGPVHGTSGDQDEAFEKVVNLADISNYPEDAPDLEADYPVFRRNYFEIDLPTLHDVQRVWDRVVQRVQAVLDAFNYYSTLEVVETRDLV